MRGSRASSRSLGVCPWTGISFITPSSKFLDLLPTAPCHQCKTGRTALVFAAQGGTDRQEFPGDFPATSLAVDLRAFSRGSPKVPQKFPQKFPGPPQTQLVKSQLKKGSAEPQKFCRTLEAKPSFSGPANSSPCAPVGFFGPTKKRVEIFSENFGAFFMGNFVPCANFVLQTRHPNKFFSLFLESVSVQP